MEPPMLKDGTFALSAALMLGLSFCNSAALAAEASTHAYAQLQDRPPARETPALTIDEQKKLKEQLTHARDRTKARVKENDAGPAPKTKKP
jgi:hypothetical protein